MPTAEEVLTARQRAILGSLRGRTSAALMAAWDRLDGYDTADIPRWVRLTEPILDGAKAATVSSSSAYYAAVLDIPPPPVLPEVVSATPATREPFTAVWHALSEGRPYDEAVRVGRSAVDATTSRFITSTARQTGDAVIEFTPRRVKWRRVASSGACDWCRARHGGIYLDAGSGDYGHDRCACFVVPFSEF